MQPNLSDIKSSRCWYIKTVVGKLDIYELEFVPPDLSKLSNVMDNDIVKKVVCDELVKKVNTIYATDTSKLVAKIDNYTKIKDMEDKIPNLDKHITAFEFNQFSCKII